MFIESDSLPAFTIAFSYPKNIPTPTMLITLEKIPHSPNASGENKRDSIGVTINGTKYIKMLLADILRVFFNSGLDVKVLILFIKIYIF